MVENEFYHNLVSLEEYDGFTNPFIDLCLDSSPKSRILKQKSLLDEPKVEFMPYNNRPFLV